MTAPLSDSSDACDTSAGLRLTRAHTKNNTENASHASQTSLRWISDNFGLIFEGGSHVAT